MKDLNLTTVNPQEYAQEVPVEIRQIIRALDDDDRLTIIIALLKHGRMTFSELKSRFNMNPSSLQNHLSKLLQASLIDNYYERGEGKSYSYYDITEIPEKVFQSLYDAVLAEEELELPTSKETVQSTGESQKEERRELREVEEAKFEQIIYGSEYGRKAAPRATKAAVGTATITARRLTAGT